MSEQDKLSPAKRILLESLIRLGKGVVSALEQYLRSCS